MDAGYEISHKGILCWTRIPQIEDVALTQILFLILEAALTYALRAVHAVNESYMEKICPWDVKTLSCGGLASHNPLMESMRGDVNLSVEELQAEAKELKEK